MKNEFGSCCIILVLFCLPSFVFQVLSITARDGKQCLLLVHAILETCNTCEGKYEHVLQVKFK